MKHVKFILAIIFMLIIVTLLVQNHQAMSTQVVFNANFIVFKVHSGQISLYHIVTIAFLFGVVITGLYGIVERFRLKKEIKNLKKVSSERDKELNSLRNFPITSEEISSETPDES